MRLKILEELRAKNLLTEQQYHILEPVASRKVISVFYELRVLLYAGVLLFSTGIGILIYKNIDDIGHIIAILCLFLCTISCLLYAFYISPGYSNAKVETPSPYFDYVVLLGCLLFISVLGYLQYQYSIFDERMGTTTLVTALFFFFMAYRFDHIGVLSLAITALASFWSISISPQKWYSGDFLSAENLYITAMIFGAMLALCATGIDLKGIKKHFTFTYMNFSALVFLTGALTGIFVNEDSYGWYLLILYFGCALAAFFATVHRSFLFLVYAFLYTYIGTTYFLSDTVLRDPFVWFIYLIASCGGFVFFIVRYRNYFKRAE